MSNAVLQIRGLRKILKSAHYEFELSISALTLLSGRFYGLVGKSGSGKSTLLDILAMVSAPTSVESFEVYANSKPINVAHLIEQSDDRSISYLRMKHFGYVLQNGGLFSFLTVRRNLELPLKLLGRPAAMGELEDMTRPFEMEEHLDKYPSELSGGQRQRVSILRALCLSPAIVLADEPTASVDENMAKQIVDELKKLATQNNTSVLLVSHDIELVTNFADEVFLLRNEAISEFHSRSEIQLQ